MNLTQAIRDANAEVEIAEAAITAGEYALKQRDPAQVMRELVGYLFSDDEQPLIGTHWDVPRVCMVLLPRGRFGDPLSYGMAHSILPRRAFPLTGQAFWQMRCEGLLNPPPPRPVIQQVPSVRVVTCADCGCEHACPPSGRTAAEEVRMLVLSRINETGKVPSSRSVARLLGKNDDRTIRNQWDALARIGKLPPRKFVPPPLVTQYSLTAAGEELASEFCSPYENLSALDAYAQGSAIN